jgi:hypothetical protein
MAFAACVMNWYTASEAAVASIQMGHRQAAEGEQTGSTVYFLYCLRIRG